MNSEQKSLLQAKRKWEKDIQKYQEFLKGDVQTFEARFGAQEFIALAQNRLEAINSKIKKGQSSKDFI